MGTDSSGDLPILKLPLAAVFWTLLSNGATNGWFSGYCWSNCWLKTTCLQIMWLDIGTRLRLIGSRNNVILNSEDFGGNMFLYIFPWWNVGPLHFVFCDNFSMYGLNCSNMSLFAAWGCVFSARSHAMRPSVLAPLRRLIELQRFRCLISWFDIKLVG